MTRTSPHLRHADALPAVNLGRPTDNEGVKGVERSANRGVVLAFPPTPADPAALTLEAHLADEGGDPRPVVPPSPLRTLTGAVLGFLGPRPEFRPVVLGVMLSVLAPMGVVQGDAFTGAPLSEVTFSKMLDRTARHESGEVAPDNVGGRYGSIDRHDGDAGISYGLLHFNQRRGALPHLLRRLYAADPLKFVEIFGDQTWNLLNERWVRRRLVLSDTLQAALQAAGAVPIFQEVHRTLARELYLEPAQQLAAEFGLSGERALAMIFDTCVQWGVGGAHRFLRRARHPDPEVMLTRFAQATDVCGKKSCKYERRTVALVDPGLTD